MMARVQCKHFATSWSRPGEVLADVESLAAQCGICGFAGRRLWMCLHKSCYLIACDEQGQNDGTMHYRANASHCIHMNLLSFRCWCHVCEREVRSPIRIDNTDPATPALVFNTDRSDSESADNDDDNADDDDDDDGSPDVSNALFENLSRPYGLVGLQNIGNTCYMNAALQAMSNAVPLTKYFLDCSAFIDALQRCTPVTMSRDVAKQLELSRAYLHLINEMWNKNADVGYVVPKSVLVVIRSVHPMFRGYHQHDTQEFLRCFMDQLHEELKQPIDYCDKRTADYAPDNNYTNGGNMSNGVDEDDDDWSDDNNSECEYETCDSGVSERSSLSDELPNCSSQTSIISRKRSNEATTNKRKLSPDARTNLSCSKLNGTTHESSTSAQIGQQPKRTIKYQSIISDVFDGKLSSSVQCLTCNGISTRLETFQDLSLPIPSRDHLTVIHQSSSTKWVSELSTASDFTALDFTGDGWFSLGWWWHWLRSWFYGPTVSLYDCLAAFFSADELKGDNMYSCDKCKKLRNGIKYSKVVELPEVLCIHLKRFRHELMFSSKISNYVSFPLTGLDMRQHCHQKDCVSDVSVYNLSSAICHHGTANGGHYTCYALNPINQQWYEYDDQIVTEVSADVVAQCQAYVLFYKKVDTSVITAKRTRIADLMQCDTLVTPRDSCGDALQFYLSRYWLAKFFTCAEPGPINNRDFLCIHGAVIPQKMPYINNLTCTLPQNIWEYLYESFGGGPACNHLHTCAICEALADELLRRRRHESETFSRLNSQWRHGVHDAGNAVYAISMNWFRLWQAFIIRGQTDDAPPPINNKSIVLAASGENGAQLRASSDYFTISDEMWLFFVGTYGGGPEVKISGGQQKVHSAQSSSTSSGFIDARTRKRSDSIKVAGKTDVQRQRASRHHNDAASSDSDEFEGNQASSTECLPKICKYEEDDDDDDDVDEDNVNNTATDCTLLANGTFNRTFVEAIVQRNHTRIQLNTCQSNSPQSESNNNNRSDDPITAANDSESIQSPITPREPLSELAVVFSTSESPEDVLPGLKRPPKVYKVTQGVQANVCSNESDAVNEVNVSLQSNVDGVELRSRLKIPHDPQTSIVNDEVTVNVVPVHYGSKVTKKGRKNRHKLSAMNKKRSQKSN